ncbi:MAG TPA: MAPEG family protein [Polyangia bacterium]|nr:MAPEG family protein [Polyangia bacterium]
MSPLVCLVAFALWALLLVGALGLVRGGLVLVGRRRPTDFPGGVQHGGDAYWRLNRAHLNTVENLPIFGAIVLSGVVLHVATPMFLLLPKVIVCARVVQSLAHLSSGRSLAINARFTAFIVQVASMFALAIEVLRRATGS